MMLIDLNPVWVGAGGEGITDKDGNPVPTRRGVGITFDCPCGDCGVRAYVQFANPLDGGPIRTTKYAQWDRVGDTFETLTLSPSIHRAKRWGGCGWHGYLRSGVLTPC